MKIKELSGHEFRKLRGGKKKIQPNWRFKDVIAEEWIHIFIDKQSSVIFCVFSKTIPLWGQFSQPASK